MADLPSPDHFRPAPATLPHSAGRGELSRLATAVSRYGVWARIIDDGVPYLRVSNPASESAEEDVFCEPRTHHHAFIASFGVYLGGSDSIELTASKIAWLVGATAE